MPELALSVSDLNVTINHEPRLLDLTIAERLGFTDPHKIRTLIQRNLPELEGHGAISATVAEKADSLGRGRPGREYWLNEPQSLLICMFSRTDNAAAVRRALIEVFMEWRRQQTEPRKVKVREHVRRVPARVEALPLPAPKLELLARPAPPEDDDRYVSITVGSGAPAPYAKGDRVIVDLVDRRIPPGDIALVADPDYFGEMAVRMLEIDPLALWRRDMARGIVGVVRRQYAQETDHPSLKFAYAIVLGRVIRKQ